MLISVKGEPAPELWAAADVTGYGIHIRRYGEDKVSVYASGYRVFDDLKWCNYDDLVSQLRGIKKHESIRIGAWRA
jgi:hypothetical protein